MRQRQRTSDTHTHDQADPSGNPGGLAQVRETAHRLAAAADAAINVALSGNSEAFLAASRQRSAQ
jgi:hypothetical protein